MIDLAILGLLKDEDLHGYELKKRIAELPCGAPGVSFGSLYPALARLERAGSVRAIRPLGTSRPPIPMTGALSGEIAAFRSRARSTHDSDPRADEPAGPRATGRRAKKVYGLTESGAQRLESLLLEGGGDDRTFEVRVAFCRHLRPDQRVALFDQRRHELLGRKADDERRPTAIDGAATEPYLCSLRNHQSDTLTTELTWLDELLAAAQEELENPGDLAPASGGNHP